MRKKRVKDQQDQAVATAFQETAEASAEPGKESDAAYSRAVDATAGAIISRLIVATRDGEVTWEADQGEGYLRWVAHLAPLGVTPDIIVAVAESRSEFRMHFPKDEGGYAGFIFPYEEIHDRESFDSLVDEIVYALQAPRHRRYESLEKLQGVLKQLNS